MRSLSGVALTLLACACGTVSSDPPDGGGADSPPTIDGPAGTDSPSTPDSPGTPDSTVDAGVDECALGLDDCDVNATCVDQDGSPGFMCACNVGWSGDGVTCTNIDEC